MKKSFNKIIKDIFDKIISIFALTVLSPLFVIIAVLIKLDSQGPVFFIQERAGLKEKLFNSFKFRTMMHKAAERGLGLNIREGDERITRVGRFLRAWSLDELPQLINVLKGDMSIVGPRPTLQYQIELYNNFQRKRLLVKPGITGWAQVNGRNAISWEQRIKLDVWYMENWSLWLDFRIILKTLRVVIKKEGLYGECGINDAFMPQNHDESPSIRTL